MTREQADEMIRAWLEETGQSMGKYSMSKTIDKKAPAPAPKQLDLVEVPREHAETYWALPWVSVQRAADDGEDGLASVAVVDSGKGLPPRAPTGKAWLREHNDGSGRTVLYSQGW